MKSATSKKHLQLKIAITVISSLMLLSFLFFLILYYYGGFSYMYHSQAVVYDFYKVCAIAFAIVAVMVALIVTMFKAKKAFRIICAIILCVTIPVFAFLSLVTMLGVSILFANGCSYTEDIANYGKYDVYAEGRSYFFPESITEDMQVVKFVYFDKYVDVEQVDIFLEVRFSTREVMDEYIEAAKEKMISGKSSNKTQYDLFEHQNPYDESYTDIIKCYYNTNGELETYSCIEFYDEGHKTVNMSYDVISYSYDELTVIYSSTSLTSGDILYGNDPDAGDYCAAYLIRFGVEYNTNNSITHAEFIERVLNKKN